MVFSKSANFCGHCNGAVKKHSGVTVKSNGDLAMKEEKKNIE